MHPPINEEIEHSDRCDSAKFRIKFAVNVFGVGVKPEIEFVALTKEDAFN